MSVDSIANSVASQITGAISQAAHSTGISFEYLLATAKIESNLNPAAQAASSTAKGLYQFIEQTWLATVKQAGPALGLGGYADSIMRMPDGRYVVPDAATRTAIMQLRSDPAASSMMAAAFTRANADQLAAVIGRAPTEGELYIAHFLGSDGAAKLIGAVDSEPTANAAALFPQAAAANRPIFYDQGRGRSVSEVYAKLTGRFMAARAIAVDPVLRGTLDTKMAAAAVPDPAGVTQAYAQAFAAPTAPPSGAPVFQSMFTDPQRGAVTRTVNSLWTRGDATGVNRAAPAPAFDLFTDGPRAPRGPFPGKV